MYKIVFTKQAAKSLQKIPGNIAGLIREKLAQISNDPFTPNPHVSKLQGRPGYHLRVGNWRVIFEIQKEELVIIIIKIAPRGEVYR